jgi:hypothetical protein
MIQSVSQQSSRRVFAPLIETRSDVLLIILGIFFSLIISIGFLVYQMKHPGCCDADNYREIAQTYVDKGLLASHPYANLRTYFYPLALSYLLSLAHTINIRMEIVVWIFQWFVYTAATLVLSLAVARKNKKYGIVTFLLSGINIFISPYFSTTLTDSLYTSLTIFWFAAAIAMAGAGGQSSFPTKTRLLISATLMSGAILAIRPAGVWVAGGTAFLLLSQVLRIFRTDRSLNAAARLLGLIVACFLFFVLPLIPQVLINDSLYNKMTPFPVENLGSRQIIWGIQYLKYGTNMSRLGQMQMNYVNPFLENESEAEEAMLWYQHHPLAGAAIIGIKFVGAFDFDYLTPYIYDVRPFYRWPSAFVSLSIFFFGLWGLFRYTFFRGSHIQRFFGERFFPAVCLLLWGAVTLVSALELRFTLPILTLFIVLGIERVSFVAALRGRKLALAVGASLVSLSFLLIVASFISGTKYI